MTPVSSWAQAPRKPRLHCGVRTQRGIEKEPVYGWKDGGKRVERFEPLRQEPQGAVHVTNIAALLQDLAKARKGIEGSITCRIEQHA